MQFLYYFCQKTQFKSYIHLSESKHKGFNFF